MTATMKLELIIFYQVDGKWNRQARRFPMVKTVTARSRADGYTLAPVAKKDPLNPQQALLEDIGVNKTMSAPALANDYMSVSFIAVRDSGEQKKFDIPNVISARADMSYAFVELTAVKGGRISAASDHRGGEAF